MCVDHSQTLWGVFDIYGTTTQIVVSKIPVAPVAGVGCSPNAIVQHCSPSQQPCTASIMPTVCYAQQPPMVRSNILEVNTDANGGTVLIVNLPAAQPNQMCHPSPTVSQHGSGGHQQQASARPPSVTIQQIQPRVSTVVQPEVTYRGFPDFLLVRFFSLSTNCYFFFCIL